MMVRAGSAAFPAGLALIQIASRTIRFGTGAVVTGTEGIRVRTRTVLLDETERGHERALAESKISRLIVTTGFVLLELGNACARVKDHADFLALVAGMRASPRVKIVPLNSELFNRGLARMRERSDKDWLLTDCNSFVVMVEEGLHEALTGDQHFEQAGFKALLK
jgi:hypothetical protein